MERARRIGRQENPDIVAVCPPGGIFAPPDFFPEPKTEPKPEEVGRRGNTGNSKSWYSWFRPGRRQP
jgi:hypothetical protein